MCYRTTTDASSRALKYAPEFSKKMVQKLNINLKQTGLVMGATGRTFDRSFDRLLVWADFGVIDGNCMSQPEDPIEYIRI